MRMINSLLSFLIFLWFITNYTYYDAYGNVTFETLLGGLIELPAKAISQFSALTSQEKT